ncbi:MAG TPA: hypothetical protein VMF90_10940 [Rhizobiaceae bacterium]|nr:hypothetical protein [Rhizobiaceae bacterium]
MATLTKERKETLSTERAAEIRKRKPIRKITAADMSKFGRFIMELALDHSKIPLPHEQDKIRALLQANGAIIPPEVKNITIVAQEVDSVIITVPPTELMEQTLAQLSAETDAGAIYPLPAAYELMVRDMFEGSLEDFYEVRVADYTLGFCR